MTKEGVEAVKKGMRKSILNAVFMAVILVLTLLAVFKGEDLGKILLYNTLFSPIIQDMVYDYSSFKETI